MKIIRTPFFITMSCCNSWCGYNPCCNPCYNPCCNPCCYSYSIVLGTPLSTTITGTLATSIVFSLANPTNNWNGSGTYTTTTGTSTTGSATFTYNGGCCGPSFTIPVSATYNTVTSTGTLTVSICCNCVTLTGTINVGSGTIIFNGSGGLNGCGNQTVTIQNITLTGSV